MSLYSLATDLFEDIDKVRAAAPDPTTSAQTQPRGDRLCINVDSEVQLPQLVAWRQNGKIEQTPTLELLEGCLHDIHEIRCGARPTPVTETKHSRSEGKLCHIDDNGRTSSSCSEASLAEGELIYQGNNTEGGTSILDPENGGGVGVVVKRGGTKAAIGSLVEVPVAELWSSGREKKTRPGSPTTARTPTIIHESDGIGKPSGYASPRLLSSDKHPATTDQCTEKPFCIGTDVAANEIYADFEREITEWSASAGVGGRPRMRTDMATHLSEKYLCRKLDEMPSSAVVSQLRREIVRRTDLLVSGTDPQVDDDVKELTTLRSCIGHNKLDVKVDEDQQAMNHRTDGRVHPLPVNGRKDPAVLAHRVTRYRGPTANQAVSVDCVDGGPIRQTEISIQAGRKLPCMRGVSPDGSSSSSNELSRVPAPSFGELYTTPKRLAVGGLGAGGSITGEAPSRLKRVAQQIPSVRTGKGGVSSSTSAVRPRARAVHFLLGVNDGESRPRSAGVVVNGSPARSNLAKLEAVNQASVESLWTCVVCGKTNEKGGVSCTICGKRQQRHGCVAKVLLGASAEAQDPAAIGREPTIVKPRREHRQESVHLESRGDSVRSDSKTGTYLGGGSGIGGVRDSARSFCGPDDASSFAKMRKEAEPAVRARLSLTGEIKSLLWAIRRNG